MDLSSILKSDALINKYQKTTCNVIQGRVSKHQIMASLNNSDKSVTHSMKLPSMLIKGSKKNELYTFDLKLYLSFKVSEPTNYIAFSITNRNSSTIKLEVQVSLEKSDASLEQFGKYSCFLDQNEERKSYFLKDKLMRQPCTYMPEGKMTIICSVAMDTPNNMISDVAIDENANMCGCNHLASRYDPNVYFDPIHGYCDELSDFTVAVDKCSFKCHKVILSSKSDVFHHMFLSKMKEAQADSVIIKDMDSETISNLLIFMYTENIDPEKITIQLLGAADKYMIGHLKMKCEDELSRRVNKENACEYWYGAYLHQAQKLKKTALETMAKNLNEIKDTPRFQELEMKIPELMKMISSALCDAFNI